MSQELRSLDDVKKFDPKGDYTEVHAHPTFRFKQNGVYFGAHGEPLEFDAMDATNIAALNRINKTIRNKAAASLKLEGAHVGPVPDVVNTVRQENRHARAAEDLLA